MKFGDYINFKSIKAKYLITGLVICLVSLLLVSLTSYIVSYNITAQQSNMRIQMTAQKNAAELDLWFRQYGQIIEDTAADMEIGGDYDPIYLQKLTKAKVDNYKEDVYDVYIGFADNKLISGTSWVPPEDYSCQTRNWYVQAINNKGVIYTEPYLDSDTNKMIITIAKAVKKNGEIIGVLAADIFVTNVIDVVSNYSFGEGSYAFLIDQGGNFLVHRQKEFLPNVQGMKNIGTVSEGAYSKLKQILKNDQMELIELEDYDGEDKYFVLSKIKSCDWVLGIAIMKSEYKKPLTNLLYGFALAVFVSLLASVGIMLKLINSMTQPIKYLSDIVKNFSNENMSPRARITKDDEIGELALSFNQMADTIQEYSQSLERKVADRTKELQEKNNNIMESIDYAQRLQRAILPLLPQRLGLDEEKCFVVWQPKDVVGGDMYWCRGDEQYALVAVVDCTGHGVPGALMSMTLGSILDGLPRELTNQKPSDFLYLIHTRLKETLGQDKKNSLANDGADIALCLIDKKNNKILFAGAKLSFFVENKGQITEYKGARHSVGYSWRKEVVFEDCEIEASPGSVVYMTTDGLLDQNSEEGKGGLGRKGFISFLETIAGKSLTVQKQKVEELISTRLTKVEQRDDITVMGFEIH